MYWILGISLSKKITNMTNNLQQRFKDRLSAGFFDDVSKRRADGRTILAFIVQEFELAAQEVEKVREIDDIKDYNFGKNVGLTDAAAIIRNRISG